jgi:hypothetical protein
MQRVVNVTDPGDTDDKHRVCDCGVECVECHFVSCEPRRVRHPDSTPHKNAEPQIDVSVELIDGREPAYSARVKVEVPRQGDADDAHDPALAV